MHPLLARVCAPSIFLDIIDYIKGRKPKKSSPQTKEKKVGINWTDDLEKELELVSKRQSSSKNATKNTQPQTDTSTIDDEMESLGAQYHALFTSTTNCVKDFEKLAECRKFEVTLRQFLEKYKEKDLVVQKKLLENVQEALKKATGKEEVEEAITKVSMRFTEHVDTIFFSKDDFKPYLPQKCGEILCLYGDDDFAPSVCLPGEMRLWLAEVIYYDPKAKGEEFVGIVIYI
jgi:hypothetical protein